MRFASPITRPTVAASTDNVRRMGMLTVLLVGQFMALLDLFVVNVALPAISTRTSTPRGRLCSW